MTTPSAHKIHLVVSLCTAYILWDKIPSKVFKSSNEGDGPGITNPFRKMKDSWALGRREKEAREGNHYSGISITSCLVSS